MPMRQLSATNHFFNIGNLLACDCTERGHEVLAIGEWVELGEGPLGVVHAQVDMQVGQDKRDRNSSCSNASQFSFLGGKAVLEFCL